MRRIKTTVTSNGANPIQRQNSGIQQQNGEN